MTNFRLKLAFILLTSELNKALWLRPVEQHGDGSTSNIQIVEFVKKDYTPKESYKRKRTPSPLKNSNEDGLSKEIDNKKLIYIYIHILFIYATILLTISFAKKLLTILLTYTKISAKNIRKRLDRGVLGRIFQRNR
jgi:hypothetical protein